MPAPTPRTCHPTLPAVLLLMVLVACGGPRTLKERTVYGERRADEAAMQLGEAERELRALRPERAQEPLSKAQELLAHPDVDLSPEAELLRTRLAELREAEGLVRQEIARQQLTAEVEKQRDSVVQAREQLATALESLEQPGASPQQVEAAHKALGQLRERLQQGKELEAKEPDYAASARRTEERVRQGEALIRRVELRQVFASGPLAAYSDARALEALARKDRAQQLTLLTQARDRYQQCNESATRLLTESPGLEPLPFATEKGTATAKAVVSECKAKTEALGSTVAKLEKKLEKKQKRRGGKGSRSSR
jgi:hypothetical protein